MNSWPTRLRAIVRMTSQHALSLAKFVSLYKIMMIAQRKMHGGKSQSADTFFAGLVGGYTVFGDRTAINEQVRLINIKLLPTFSELMIL